MNYLLVVLDFHDYFPSQIIWACHWQLSVLVQWLHLLVVCWLWLVVTHLFELTFEFAPIVRDNKLRSRVTCQPGVMKQILDGCCWLIFGFDTFNPASVWWWIYHCECKQRVCFGWCPYCKWTHHIHTNHDPGMQSQILLFWVGAAHISFVHAPSLSFDILDKWNINNQFSTSGGRPGKVMVFLIVFSFIVCSGWSKYSWYQMFIFLE
jgi:hypothetical protein